jgi:hypothetical protein
MKRRESVQNSDYLKRYFTQFPNIIDDSALDPYEFRLLIHYYRVGKCWEGVRATAEKCKISVGKVSSLRKQLQAKGFIKINEQPDGSVVIFVIDKAKENVLKYTRSQDEQVFTESDGVFTPSEKTRSQDEHKNNHIKNNPKEDVANATATELFPKDVVIKADVVKPELYRNWVYSQCVDFWLKDFHVDWEFGGMQGKAMKSVITKIGNTFRKRGQEPTYGDVVDFFKVFCRNLPVWFSDKDLNVIDQKYNEIIEQIEKGKSTNGSGSANWIDDLYQRAS